MRNLVLMTVLGSAVTLASAQQHVPEPTTPGMKQVATSEKPATLRLRMVKEAAMSAAMRAGLAKQSEFINQMLDQNGRLLDDTYDFPSLMLPNNVVPPVIRKMEKVTEHDGDVLRYSAFQFQIVKQAHFSTRAPTWRTYLPLPIWTDLGTTHPSLLPTNASEQEAAKAGIAIGWQAGVEQANQMFYKGLTRLQNDWLGMNTYHALLKSNMVTAPLISRTDTAVSGDASNMVIDESTYQIEARPVFNPGMSQWLALIDKAGAASFFKEKKSEDASERKAVIASPSLDQLMQSWSIK